MCLCVSVSRGLRREVLKLGRVSYCAFSDIKAGLFHTVGGGMIPYVFEWEGRNMRSVPLSEIGSPEGAVM